MENKILLLAFLVVGAECNCCFPKQFEGMLGMSAGVQRGGKGIAFQLNFKMSIDITNNMMAFSGEAFYEGTPIKEQVLQDFNKGIQYVVVNGNCTKGKLNEPSLLACIPKDAKKVMSSYYGITPANNTNFDMYTFIHEGNSFTIAVETGSCAPVAEHIQNKDGIYDSGYMGLTPGIADRKVFDIPRACQKVYYEPRFDRLHSLRKKRPSVFTAF